MRALRPEAPEGYRLRPGRSGDAAALAQLEHDCFAGDRISARNWRRLAGSGTALITVVEKGRTVVAATVLLYRRNTSVARLYSIAVAPAARGHGLSRLLLEHALARAHADRSAVLRLETREDNVRAQALFESCGFGRFGRRDGYYEDGAAALLYEKTLWDREGATPAVALRCPFYAQTLDFTCGPCSLLMAMAALDPRTRIDRTSEIRLWRESTTVYLAAGHGGCGPFGLAAAALRRGFDVRVHAPPGDAMFIDSVRDPRKKEVIELVEADFRAEVLRCAKAEVSHSPVSAAAIMAHLAAGRVPIVLISLWRLHGERGPHWVVVTGFDGAVFRLLDPIATPGNQDPGIPVSLDEFRRITRYGKRRQTAAIILSKET